MKKILIVLATLLAFISSAEARKVSGVVMCGVEPMEGVLVTDGANFTATNFKGKFAFEINDDAEHVYIITPAGYVADWTSGVPAFYQKAAGQTKFQFNLQKTAGGGDYNIIAIADPQTKTMAHFEKFTAQPLSDVTKVAQSLDGVTVGLTLGDIVWDEFSLLDEYKKAIVKTQVPFYPVVGNHDNMPGCHDDLEGSAVYRSKMGPENYAFFLGGDVVIVLDNMICGEGERPHAGYADHVLTWLKGLMAHVPAGADLYIAQHAPTIHHGKRIFQANKMLDIVRGHKVTFLSGHTHVNNNFTIERNITEHNIAAICGAWWDTELCTDGTPKGFKVFTKFGGHLSWYYKPVGASRKHIAEAFSLSEMPMHPNSVVVNVWDWDPKWSVRWYEDGIEMGEMDQVKELSSTYDAQIEAAYDRYGDPVPAWKRGKLSSHYFAATPSRYAKRITIAVEGRFGQKWTKTVDLTGFVEDEVYVSANDISNEKIRSIAENGANSVAFDLYVSMDGEVRAGNAAGLLLSELIDSTDAALAKARRSSLRYNIEMHTVTGKEEGKTVPYYHRYADYVMDGLWMKFMGDRLMVTGSDYRALNHLNSRYPEVDIAFKVAPEVEDVQKAMARLKFTPKWISFHYSKVDAALIQTYRQKGYCVSVWGIPDDETKNRIKALGPDAVIF